MENKFNVKNGLTVDGDTVINGGLTANTISATTYYNLPPFTGNTLSNCISNLYVSNIYSCSPSPLYINPFDEGDVQIGSTSLFVDSSTYHVGIGIYPPQARLHVNNTSFTDNSLLVDDSSNPDSTPFVIDNSGNTGIGTLTPSKKLHVNGNTLINGDLITNKITGTTLNISQTPNNETSALLNLLSRDSVNGEVKIKTIPNTFTYGLFSQTADGGPVTATDVETTIIGTGVGTLTVPANGFQIGDSFTCALDGLISCLNSSEIEVRVKTLSGVLLADTGIIDLAAATNKSWLLTLYFTIRTLGTAGTASISSGGLFSYVRNGGTQFEGYVLSSLNNTTFDTTINNTLVVTVQWNTNSIDNSILSRNFILQKVY